MKGIHVIETPPTKFQRIRSTRRGGHAIWNFEFSSKNVDFLPTLALIFSVKIPGIVAFFDLALLKLHFMFILWPILVFVL